MGEDKVYISICCKFTIFRIRIMAPIIQGFGMVFRLGAKVCRIGFDLENRCIFLVKENFISYREMMLIESCDYLIDFRVSGFSEMVCDNIV